MTFVMIFLVLTLVVFMAETGECRCFIGRALAGKSQGWEANRFRLEKNSEKNGVQLWLEVSPRRSLSAV
uniref:Secreted protein n=1 Tax=Lates calcarifer TaxID=8187 RepID=A0A4W6DE35_LATCA